jgi:hypothetical protein
VKVGRYGRGFPTNLNWDEFLSRVLSINKSSGMSLAQEYLLYPYIYSEEGVNFLDHVFYFEDLEGSINELTRLLGLKTHAGSDKVYRFKVNKLKEKDYRTYYTDRQAEDVQNHFRKFLSDYPYVFDKVSQKP